MKFRKYTLTKPKVISHLRSDALTALKRRRNKKKNKKQKRDKKGEKSDEIKTKEQKRSSN